MKNLPNWIYDEIELTKFIQNIWKLNIKSLTFLSYPFNQNKHSAVLEIEDSPSGKKFCDYLCKINVNGKEIKGYSITKEEKEYIIKKYNEVVF